MIAIVKEIDHNANIGKWETTKLTVENAETGKESYYNVFNNRKAEIAAVGTLKPGDRINLTLKQNGEHWNYASHELMENAPTGGGKPSGNGNGQDEFRRTKEEMRRNESLGMSIALVAATLTGKSNPHQAAEMAVSIAPLFEPYLSDGVDVAAMMGATTEEAPNATEDEVPF